MAEEFKEPDEKKKSAVSTHILLVDDDEAILDLGQNMLVEEGHTVTCCEDGEKAVQFFNENHENIDIVILDMVMPKMNGYDCFLKLNEIDSSVPVIISSGYCNNDELQKILNMGAKAFLQKPYAFSGLDEIISKVIKK